MRKELEKFSKHIKRTFAGYKKKGTAKSKVYMYGAFTPIEFEYNNNNIAVYPLYPVFPEDFGDIYNDWKYIAKV